MHRGTGGARRGLHCLDLGRAEIGKSRITPVVSERVSDEPHTHLRYFCLPHHQHRALHLNIAQLEQAGWVPARRHRRAAAADAQLIFGPMA